MDVSSVGGTKAANFTSAAPRTGKATSEWEHPTLAVLTPADKELVYQATGQRVGPESRTTSAFAETIARDRAMGAFGDGGAVSADYLRDMVKQYTGENNGMAAQADMALRYLLTGKAPGRQVTL